MAVTCCYAARALHARGLVHRDLRLANLVQLGPKHFTVIDLESAARVSPDSLPQDFSSFLRTCTSSALDEARFVTLQMSHPDMLQSWLPGACLLLLIAVLPGHPI